MAHVVADRVKETTTTEGTGAFTLAGAVNGFFTFSSRLSVGDTTWYAAVSGTQWEVGLGTLSASTTLQRTAVLASTNGDAAVSFSAGAKEVFIDLPAALVDKVAGFALPETSIASATTIDLGAANSRRVAITGTTAITSFGTRANCEKLLRFTAALTLTFNAASLILPGGASIRTAAGDTALATSDASGNWTVRSYQRADGTPLSGGPTMDGFRTLAIQVAKLKGSALGLFDAVIDDFRDQTGYDTANSTGATWDSSSNTIRNQSIESTESLAAMTGSSAPSGQVAASNAATVTNYEPYRAFDHNTGTFWQATFSNPTTLSRTFPAQNVSAVALQMRSDQTANYPRDFNIDLYDGSSWTTVITRSFESFSTGERRVYSVPSGNYSGVRINITSTISSSGYVDIVGFEALLGTVTALDLRSVAFTAQAVPTKGSIFILVKALAGTITPGTNLTASLSRDGGTTYTAFSLASAGTIGGFTIYEANGLDISGQPSGTSMKWRLQTTGTALAVQADAVVAQWG